MKHVGNLQYITFLKGLAILGVILVHAPQLIKEINPLIREFLHAGAFGCQLFFVISGFLAVKSWERLLAKYENSTEKNRTTYKTFLKKRYLSIAPIYILFILFYQIISYYIATFNVEPFYKISHNPLSILANIFLLNGLDYQAFNNIVPGGWFIGTIFLFYLLFPLIYKLYRYIKTYNPRLLFLLPLGGVIVSAIFQTGIFFIIGDWTLSKPGSFTYYSIINQLPCMLIGVTLNYYLKNTKLSKNNLLLCFICLGLIGNLLWYALRLHYWIYALIPSIIGWSFFYLFLYVQRKSEEIRGGGNCKQPNAPLYYKKNRTDWESFFFRIFHKFYRNIHFSVGHSASIGALRIYNQRDSVVFPAFDTYISYYLPLCTSGRLYHIPHKKPAINI